MPDGLGRQASDPAAVPSTGPVHLPWVRASATGWEEDDALLHALWQAYPHPPQDPRRIRAAAEWALHWRSAPASDLGGERVAGPAWSRLDNRHRTRSTDGEHRTLAFVAPPLGIEIELLRTRIVGQVIPPGEAEIRLESDDGTTISVQADDLGFFDLPTRPAGAVRIICERPSARLVTDWVAS